MKMHNIFFDQLQESEKVLALHCQIDQEHSKKSTLLSELSLQKSETAHLKAKEMQLVKEVDQLRESKRKIDEDYAKLRNDHRDNIVQVTVLHCVLFKTFTVTILSNL